MLKIENISKTFNPGTINEKAALQGLSLHLLPGDFVTIIGSNGAGKSTLFNAICGSFFTDSGSIYLDRRNITFLPEYQRSRIPPLWTPPRQKRCWKSPVRPSRKTISPPSWSPTICTRPWSLATAR